MQDRTGEEPARTKTIPYDVAAQLRTREEMAHTSTAA